MFKAKIYKLGRSGRLAIMLPKEQVFEPGEYNVEIMPQGELPSLVIVDPVCPECAAGNNCPKCGGELASDGQGNLVCLIDGFTKKNESI